MRSGTPVRTMPVSGSVRRKVEWCGVGKGFASLHLPAIHGGKWPFFSYEARMARFEKPSMLLKIPGMMAQGDFQPSLARIQKHRGQKSGRARMPRFLAEIRMNHFVDHVCRGDKKGFGGRKVQTGGGPENPRNDRWEWSREQGSDCRFSCLV